LFGQASPSPFIAIDDEDVLEFIYNLKGGFGCAPRAYAGRAQALPSAADRMQSCGLAEPLLHPPGQPGAAVERSTEKGISGGRWDRARSKPHAVSGTLQPQHADLFGAPSHFVSELLRRWRERHPQPAQNGATERPALPEKIGAGEIFISYAGEDIGAARQLCSGLAAIGAGVIWLDKSKLRPGDEWNTEINAAVKRCDLFLPLLSATTETRHEGWFHQNGKSPRSVAASFSAASSWSPSSWTMTSPAT